jgi:hypothetical protein
MADLQKTIPLLESVLHVSNNSLNPTSENSHLPSGRVSFLPSFSCLLLRLHISCLIRNCMLRLNLIIWMNQMVSQAVYPSIWPLGHHLPKTCWLNLPYKEEPPLISSTIPEIRRSSPITPSDIFRPPSPPIIIQ